MSLMLVVLTAYGVTPRPPTVTVGVALKPVPVTVTIVPPAIGPAFGVTLAIVGAEYLLRLLPRGTHDWKKFLKPSEVVNGLRGGGIEAQEIVGVVYNPLSRVWSLNRRDLDVNYMLYGTRSA